jgi:hypothetical protein
MTSASPKYGEGVLSIEQRNSLFKGRDRACLEALSRVYGDSTDDILNALHSMAARIAIANEVDPEQFAAGPKYHWDAIVRFLEAGTALPASDHGDRT